MIKFDKISHSDSQILPLLSVPTKAMPTQTPILLVELKNQIPCSKVALGLLLIILLYYWMIFKLNNCLITQTRDH